MSHIEYVDVATAHAARGVRMVVSGVVPSPWSQAVKGLFQVQQVPALAVRRVDPTDAELAAFTRHHNVPVVLHDGEPPRTVWSEIVMLAARLGEPGALVPTEVEARAATMGMIHELAGEDGLGWGVRLTLIDAGLRSEGARGFPLPVSRYLAAKYGHAPERVEPARRRVREILAALERALGGREYFAGARPGALDVYAATFLTLVSPLAAEDCPQLTPRFREAFAVGDEEFGAAVGPDLAAHRRRMLERHLGWPIEI